MPHIFLRVQVQIGGKLSQGISSENLPPKWFTKNPDTTFEEDIPDLLRVATHAAHMALEGQPKEECTFFEHWQRLYHAQSEWARQEGIPPLLANLGVALVERAWIDALCRGTDRAFAFILREGALALDLGQLRPDLGKMSWREILPSVALKSIIVRHTVGLGDPLTDADTTESVNDGLPQSLEASIQAYGLTHFKIKLSGDLDFDRSRLKEMKALFDRCVGGSYLFTLDGNENFTTVEHFVEHWNTYQEDLEIREMMKHLLFVEQALHRDCALDDDVAAALNGWPNRPPLIIDESDADFASLPRALDLGYQGTSHKNCKGIVKGLANAALLKKRQRMDPDHPFYLSGEDLSNIGPVALAEDLAVMASLGISHVERNGHHYFRGLSMFPRKIQESVLADHSDLYHQAPDADFATMRIQDGCITIGSVVNYAFGLKSAIEVERFTPLDSWDVTSLAQ